MKKNALSFGLRTPAYRKVDWPNFPEYAAVGRWESEFYDPQAWRAGHGFRPFLDLTRAGRVRAAHEPRSVWNRMRDETYYGTVDSWAIGSRARKRRPYRVSGDTPKRRDNAPAAAGNSVGHLVNPVW